MVSAEVRCPCGFIHRCTGEVDAGWHGWVTIRDQDYMAVIDAEVRCRAIAGHELPAEDDPRFDEHRDQTWAIIERSGQLLECPECGRLLWRRPGEPRPHRIYRRES